MILQALCRLADQEKLLEDPDFEPKPVAWCINLRSDGTFNLPVPLRYNINEGKNRKPRWEGKSILVPRQPIRTSGDRAFFLVDKAEYALGFDPDNKRPAEKLQLRLGLFREQVEACAEATGNPDVKAVAQFLQSIAQDRTLNEQVIASFPEPPAANELIAFKVGLNDFVHLQSAVIEYWKQQRAQQDADNEAPFRCLVSGAKIAEVPLFPLIKKLPGGTTSGVALVSHNAPAFESYGLSGNSNAPISRAAAEKAATALNRLLHPAYPSPTEPGTALRVRHVRLSADTVVVFWAADSDPFVDNFAPLLAAEDEKAVAEMYRSVWSGIPSPIKNPTQFYALTLSGTQGRAIVRDWLEESLAQANHNLAQHFKDLQIVRNARAKTETNSRNVIPLRRMMESLAAIGKSESIPAALEAGFLRAALTGIPYPLQLLQRALVRTRAEASRSDWIDNARRDARAAIIKAVLNRRRRVDSNTAARYPEVTIHMNPNHPDPGYNLGLLMAVLERLQMIALGEVNASLIDKYFGAASATPRNVFIRLLKNARHHARKAKDADEGKHRGQVFRLEKLIDALANRFQVEPRRYPPLGDTLPRHLDLEQQGLFVLGYHQMRYWLWMNQQERGDWEADNPDAPRAFRYLKDKETAEVAGT